MTDLRNIILLTPEARPGKRQTVPAACVLCRHRKQKCDGRRPCSKCDAKGTDCIYETRVNETPQQAAKRKYDELAESHSEQTLLLQQIAKGDERHAVEIVRRLRSGESAYFINEMRPSSVKSPIAFSYEQRLQRNALIAICQSTAPLRDVVDLASAVLSRNARFNLLDEATETLKDKIITLEILTGILADTGYTSRLLGASGLSNIPGFGGPDGSHDGPLFYVPASPWTDLTQSDETVSHLVSLFLTYCNGYWRFLEEDLFLRAMRSRKPISEYCSPLLVHAILAWAATYSDIDEAFTTPGQLLTRGQRFHDEAIRLWQLESGRASLTNVQAALILSLESSMRGKDRHGPLFIRSAASLHLSLPSVETLPTLGKAAANYARARRAAAATIVWIDISNALALMRDPTTLTLRANEMPCLDNIPDTTNFWNGYPYTTEPMPVRSNLLLRERCNMAPLIEEVLALTTRGKQSPLPMEQLVNAATSLGHRLTGWYQNMPAALRYSKTMPPPLMEFHSQYLSVNISLYDRVCRAAFDDSGSDIAKDTETEDPPQKAEFRALSLKYAFQGACLLRDYREKYGLKVSLGWIVQLAADVIFLCLRVLHTAKQPEPRYPHEYTSFGGPIDNVHGAFAEAFRLLLGLGTHVLLPRGIARMVVHTAMQIHVQLPAAVIQMLRVVATTSWAASDLDLMDSMYPNYVLKQSSEMDENDMMTLLRKWEHMSANDQALIGSSL